MENLLLQMSDIHKRFPGVYALKGINLSVRKGEIHGLLGENGAGKSTLMKVLGGVHKQDQGVVYIDGKDVGEINPKKATELGIAFVHQELNLSEPLSVAENMYMGRLPYKNEKLGIVDKKKLHEDATKILEMLKINLKSTDLVATLPTAKKQMIEIAKAISQNAKIIILDEPTTSLADNDVNTLFRIMRDLKSKGVALIYISHRLKEIFEICDRATVMRDGQYIGECDAKKVSQKELIKMMVGRELKDLYPKQQIEIGEKILEVKNLSDNDGRVKNVSFHAKRGEILGISGLVGAGRTEVVRLLFGADKMASGEIFINGEKVNIKSPNDAISKGICLITEDRKKQGLCLPLSVADNINITNLGKEVLKHTELRKTAEDYRKSLNIKTSSIDTVVGTLSGGNQQKVVIAKWLNTDSEIFIFDEPTKGIDVGAKAEIYNMMNELAKQGKSIIIISSELPEVLGMSDRVYVMCEGKITGEVTGNDCNQEKIMELSTVGGN
ncbi:sugar ABC transporter ATP-binding protein [Clostridioides difficile]